METYINCIKGTTKKGNPYFMTKIVTPLTEQAIFGAELVLALTGYTAEQLVQAEDGELASYVMNKYKKEDKGK